MVAHKHIPRLAIEVERALHECYEEEPIRYVDAQLALRFIQVLYDKSVTNGHLPQDLPDAKGIERFLDGRLEDHELTADEIARIREKGSRAYRTILPIVEANEGTKETKTDALLIVTKKLSRDCASDGGDRYRGLTSRDRFRGY